MRVLATACALLAIAACGGDAKAPAPRGERPNIVLVMADDLGYEALSCYGGESYETPVLDALAAGGIRFEKAFATPMCTPSRVQIMTGRYPHRTGWNTLLGHRDPDRQFLDPAQETTFARVLKEAGYATAVAGKWQLAHFDEHPDNVSACGFDEHCVWIGREDQERQERYWNPVVWQNGERVERRGRTGYGPDVYSGFLIDFMARNAERPFFAYYPMTLPHSPFQPTPDSEQPRSGRSKYTDPARFPDMVAYIDKTVGRILSALDDLGLTENTVVIFTGDNGSPKDVSSRWRGRDIPGGKSDMAHGAHVPFLVSWPGTAPAGLVTDHLIDFTDVLPTLADLAGARLPDRPIDGVSFAPLLRGEDPPPGREWVLVHAYSRRFAPRPRLEALRRGDPGGRARAAGRGRRGRVGSGGAAGPREAAGRARPDRLTPVRASAWAGTSAPAPGSRSGRGGCTSCAR